LLIAKPDSKGFRVVDSFSRIIRLGEGLDQSGELSKPAMDRAMEALSICAKKMERRNVTRMRNVATEACRKASNGSEFIERAASETGLVLDIILPDEEAELAVTGCLPLLDRSCDAALVFDIGGGSTELVWLDLTEAKAPDSQPRIANWMSLPCGVITLAERFGGRDVPSEIYEEMVGHVSELIHQQAASPGISSVSEHGRFHMVGTSGTVTTIAGVHMGLKRYDRRRVDGAWIGMSDVLEVAQRLSSMDFEARIAEPCVGRERADLVIAGCAILEAINRIWPTERLRVADRGLREGMLLALMERADTEGVGGNGPSSVGAAKLKAVPAGV
jgi:exopolyphosphatase/guanosine-5'-triphosphate,3'-diphosphate pyrophosphatase